jgi:solute carrier family 26 (sodium-independent sulfate anion transporter), member 11
VAFPCALFDPFGLPSLLASFCSLFPPLARLFFYLSILRIAFTITTLTLASYLYCKPRRTPTGNYPIQILQDVSRGLRHVKAPVIDPELVGVLKGRVPVATIILLLEHIAIAKCGSHHLFRGGSTLMSRAAAFGRLNNYKVNPNQELIAIGVSNIIGSYFGAYAATGSFSRTALKSKCGVRTPAAGIATGIVVLLALYGLTQAFYWIPLAGLSAVIIHAVADLVASPASVYNFWRVSPLEWAIWVAAVLVTVFSSIENGIYISIGASVALLLVRIAHPRRNILGRAVVHAEGPSTSAAPKEGREIFLPLSSALVNPSITVTPPLPGVIVFRLEEAYLYPNASATDLFIVDYVKDHMRRGVDLSLGAVSDADWAWNDPGPTKDQDLAAVNDSRPDLKAIVMDFSAV